MAELEALVATADARRDAAVDPLVLCLRPSASDWMSAEEIGRLSDLQAALVPYTQRDRLGAQERVAVKRAARVAAREANHPKG